MAGPVEEPARPFAPLASIVPATTTSPEASIVTGVLALLGANRTVTPTGIFTVVKLKTPLAGTVKVISLVGAKAPSTPLLPLLKIWADTWGTP
jgi:hypothetical protein